MRLFILCICTAVICSTTYALDEIKSIDLSKYFKDFRESTFVLYDPAQQMFEIHDLDAAEVRRSPCSTFKIPNSLIGLESGVIKDKDHLLKWDGTKTWNENWNRDHTLETAFKHSTVWYFQELARLVGAEKMQGFVDQIDYGNKDISGGIDQFWLGDSLEISAMEQIRFLQKLYYNRLPFSQSIMDTVKDIMVYKTGDDYVLRGKTGSGFIEDETSWGWYVGYIEVKDKVYFFASNIEAKEGATGRGLRTIIVDILTDMKLITE